MLPKGELKIEQFIHWSVPPLLCLKHAQMSVNLNYFVRRLKLDKSM